MTNIKTEGKTHSKELMRFFLGLHLHRLCQERPGQPPGKTRASEPGRYQGVTNGDRRSRTGNAGVPLVRVAFHRLIVSFWE